MYEQADGPWRYLQKQGRFVTPQEVESLIGYRVNAGNISYAKFKGKVIQRLSDKADNALRDFSRGEA